MSFFASTDDDNHNIPSNFICPISQCIMIHPVMTRSGHNYERKAILTWLKEQNNTCPMTRNTLTVKDLVSNRALRAVIQAWCVANHVHQERTTTVDDNAENDDDEKEILLTCTMAQFEEMKHNNSSTTKQTYHDAIIDRAWRKRAELRKMPHFQSTSTSTLRR